MPAGNAAPPRAAAAPTPRPRRPSPARSDTRARAAVSWLVAREVIHQDEAHRLDADGDRAVIRKKRRRVMIAGHRPRLHLAEAIVETGNLVREERKVLRAQRRRDPGHM